MKSYPLSAIRYTLTLLIVLAFLSGCGSQYASEKLFWQAKQVTKKVTQNKSLDKLSTDDYQKIIAAYGKVAERCPLELLAAQSQFIITQLYVLQGQYSQAQEELIKIRQNFSRNSKIASQALFMIGNLYERQGDWEAAASEYEKVRDLYPMSELGLKVPISIAQHYQREKEELQAEKAYKQAIRNYQEIIDEYSGTRFAPIIMDYLALSYLNQGRWDEAIGVWESITKEYPETPMAAKSLLASGEIYAKQLRDPEKSIKHYEDFIQQYPDSKLVKQVKFQIGRLYLDKGDIEEARQVFSQIIKDYPKEAELCASARAMLANCYEREGNGALAIKEYQQIRRDYFKTKLALAAPFFIARCYLNIIADKDKAVDAFAEAIAKYKKIIEEEQDVPLIMEAGRFMSLCYIQQQQWNEAIDTLYSLATKYPDDSRAQLFLLDIATIYQRELAEPDKAMQIYEQLIDRYPSSRIATFAKMQLDAVRQYISNTQEED